MKLLLVDDDKIIINCMRGSFPWADWGITEIRTAWSIKQAKKILEEEQIDILLCDIEMPMGTGIELIEWMQEEVPAPVVTLLLTCHSEFQYAQRALQLGCSNYLLKPAEEEELKKAILDAEEKVVEYRKREKERKTQEQKIRNMDAFWETLMAHHISCGEKLRRVCEEYEVKEQLRFLPVYVTVKHHSYKIRDINPSLMSFILENVLREVLRGERYALVNKYDERLWLFFPENPSKDPFQPLLQVSDWMEENYHCALSCYFGQIQFLTGWEKECELLRQADAQFAVSPGIYTASQVRHTHFMPFELPNVMKSCFSGLFTAGKYTELLQKMKDYFLALAPEQCNTASLDAAIRRMDQEFERKLEADAKERFRKIQVQLFKENPAYTRTVPGLLEYYERMFACIKEERHETMPESIIQRVKLYISMNMQQELCREEVAAYVGLHPDYLNRIFKKETGVSLKEYIADAKVQMACELLEQTNFFVGEIGEMVGYVNFSSFTTFFKNRTGLTPAAWRKEHSQ